MHYKWLKKQSAQKVIIIFSGWGFSSDVFDHLLRADNCNKYDVLFVSGYQELAMELPDLSHYEGRYLLAWSFGVSAFSTWLSALSEDQQLFYSEFFSCCVAINGSMQPIDRHQGIPAIIMQKTIDTLSQSSFKHFSSRCFGGFGMPAEIDIDVDVKKQELQKILERQHEMVVIWDLVWIAKHDKIFPPKNLSRAWDLYNEQCQEPATIQYIDAPHAPFQMWSTWDEIIFKPVDCI